MSQTDLRETDLATEQQLEVLQDRRMANDLVEFRRRQQWVAVDALPDTVTLPESTVLAAIPIEEVCKTCNLFIVQEFAEGQVAIPFEDIVLLVSNGELLHLLFYARLA